MTTTPPSAAWQAIHIPAHLPANLRDAFAAQQAAFAVGQVLGALGHHVGEVELLQ